MVIVTPIIAIVMTRIVIVAAEIVRDVCAAVVRLSSVSHMVPSDAPNAVKCYLHPSC
jgi:hypothetical protein